MESPEAPGRRRRRSRPDVRRFAFGSVAAILTSVGLVVGFSSASSTKPNLIGALLIVAIADNLSDSLSIHIYQESEHLPPRTSFTTTLTNFLTRLALSMSFVVIVALLPLGAAAIAGAIWGLGLLVGLTYLLARDRGASVPIEITKHVALAAVVIVASGLIGTALSDGLDSLRPPITRVRSDERRPRERAAPERGRLTPDGHLAGAAGGQTASGWPTLVRSTRSARV